MLQDDDGTLGKGRPLANGAQRVLKTASVASLRLPARRPANSALTSERGLLLPPLEQALESFVSSRR